MDTPLDTTTPAATSASQPAPQFKALLSSPVEMFKFALNIYTTRFKELMTMIGIGVLASLPLFAVMTVYAYLPESQSGNLALQLPLGLVGAVALIAAIYFYVRVQIGLYLLIAAPTGTAAVATYRQTKPLFWTYFGTSILVGVFLILWFLLFFFPGIVMTVYYSVAMFTVIFEGLKYRAAIARSKQLVKGYWWAVFGRGLFIILLYMILGAFLSIPVVFMGEGSAAETAWNNVVQVINFVISPVMMAYSYKIYQELKNAKGTSA